VSDSRYRENDFDQRLLQFLTTIGRDGVLRAMLLGADAARSERLFAIIEQATAPMFDHVRNAKRGLVSVAKAWELPRSAVELTLPALAELGIELPQQQRVALHRDYEQLFTYLRRAAINRDGCSDLAALSVQSDGGSSEGAWLALEYRLAYIEAKLRRGQDLKESRFDEVFGTPRRPGEPTRGQRLSDAHIAKLLGLPLDGFNTLKTIRPSPAALNELYNHTGYVDRSIAARTDRPGVALMAAHTRCADGVPESDIDKLDLEADFEVLHRKFKRLKSRRSD
jgi:hypothetical protein